MRDAWKATRTSLSVALVYEDDDTQQQATTAYELLLRTMGEEAPLTATWWRISHFSDARIAQAAAGAVAASQLVLVSVQLDQPPTPMFQAWVSLWTACVAGQPKLLALLQSENHPHQTTWDRLLREAAARTGMSYLPGHVPTPTRDAGETPHNLYFEGAATTKRAIDPYQHWGLNE